MTEAGLDVGLVYAVPKERLQGDALIQRNIVDQLGLPEIPLATLLQEKAGGSGTELWMLCLEQEP
ncbi:hypothetical protein [Paenibacillus larvae]|nr:hypothetical protein [Paenibacillus larvae]MDT2254584.1 hypothetical protein [Paenibacillus larvae]